MQKYGIIFENMAKISKSGKNFKNVAKMGKSLRHTLKNTRLSENIVNFKENRGKTEEKS